MISYLIQRLLYVIPVVIGVSLICFLLVHIAPGDPLVAVMPIDATAEQEAEMRAIYGFDKPLPVQFAIWAGNALQGDLGQSIATGRPVGPEVLRAVENTLLLAFAASLIGFPLGVALGFFAGYFHDTLADRAITAFAIGGVSTPNYWLGMVFVIIFSVQLGWLPSMGAGPGGSSEWKWNAEHMRHLVLPAITLAVVPMGIVMRTTRALVADILDQDFVQALRGQGSDRNRRAGARGAQRRADGALGDRIAAGLSARRVDPDRDGLQLAWIGVSAVGRDPAAGSADASGHDSGAGDVLRRAQPRGGSGAVGDRSRGSNAT